MELLDLEQYSTSTMYSAGWQFIQNMEQEKQMMKEEEVVKEVGWLLDNLTLTNWKQLNSLLIPSQLENLQDIYWDSLVGEGEEETNISAQDISLNSSWDAG
jgi:hypothetical protein